MFCDGKKMIERVFATILILSRSLLIS
jgi:hypothetical protein